MIINHNYKFIFLKTRKTASTSIEIALSKFCAAEDIITPISSKDEKIRQELGFRGPQNYQAPQNSYSNIDRQRSRVDKKELFFNHIKASLIRKNIGDETWNSYFKFCFERNPFDKAISQYYFSTSEPRPEIDDYLCSAGSRKLSNWHIFTEEDHVVVDFVGHYENLSEDLAEIADRIGLPGKLNLPKAKAGTRKNRAHYSTLLNLKSRSRVELVCAKEIAAFDYSWEDLQNK